MEVSLVSIINKVGNKVGAWSFRPVPNDTEAQENRRNGTGKDAAGRERDLGGESNISDTTFSDIMDIQTSSKTIV
jgi:hypothetical protein